MRDAALVQRLARDNLPVEVCPSSNVSLEIFESLDAHRSFPELWRVGLNVTVNSRSSRRRWRRSSATRPGWSLRETMSSSCSAEPRARPLQHPTNGPAWKT